MFNTVDALRFGINLNIFLYPEANFGKLTKQSYEA